MKLLKLTATAVMSLAFVACSSGIKKADIAATANPSDEIARLDSEVAKGYTDQLDVLASKSFEKSQSYLSEAKKDLADGDKQSEILESVAYSQAWLTKANQTAATRREQIPGIIDARQKALDAGARQFPPTTKQLGKLDDEIRDESKSLAKLDAGEIADLQARYLELELNAVKNTQLGKAQAQIEGAKDKKAASYAPAALKRAETDYNTALNLISANRSAPDTYKDAVAKANNTADLLGAILAATNKGRVDENTASKVVMQERQIKDLEGKVATAGDQNAQLGATIQNQGQQLKQAGAVLSLQQSLEAARKEFTKEEAEVYQQGDKLLIRLKSMNFPSGTANLPAESLPILAKVKTVAAELGPKQVVVEGHTDSTGAAKLNQTLSQERASAIAKYLETNGIAEEKLQSVGYGFKKPIASNKSKDGRAQNRRVDILITPEKATEAEQPAQSM